LAVDQDSLREGVAFTHLYALSNNEIYDTENGKTLSDWPYNGFFGEL
jgi:hypothetical protein